MSDDFVTDDEIEQAPEDPGLAFLHIAQIALGRLGEKLIASSSYDEQETYYYNVEVKYSFVSNIVAFAKAYGVNEFSGVELPALRNFSDENYKQFRLDLDFYIDQLRVRKANLARKAAVPLDAAQKERIRVQVVGLRRLVDELKIDEGRKRSLHEKLDRFEAALEKQRLSLLELAMISATVFGLPGSVAASSDVISKLTGNIWQVVGDAQQRLEDDRKLPPPSEQKALMPPRSRPAGEIQAPMPNLDDEIPF
ncbi:MAG: hypothetical protein RLY86_3886 [Pseudomonadota bacterium]|jgi:hypothetical protein